jgi:hypothetical protein
MVSEHVSQRTRHRKRGRSLDQWAEYPPTIFSHPVVAASLVVIIAAAVQIGWWYLNAHVGQVTGPMTLRVSRAVVHGILFDAVEDLVLAQPLYSLRPEAFMFVLFMALALLSGVVWLWFASCHAGRRIALVAVIALVAHPWFSMVVHRPDDVLTPLILIVALAAGSLAWWYRSQRLAAAASAGLWLAVMSGFSIHFLLLLPGALLMMLLSGRGVLRSIQSMLCCLCVFAAVSIPMLAFATPWVASRIDRGRPSVVAQATQHLHASSTVDFLISRIHAGSTWSDTQWHRAALEAGYVSLTSWDAMLQRMEVDLWSAIDNGDGSSVARAAVEVASSTSLARRPNAVRFLFMQIRKDPFTTSWWMFERAGDSLTRLQPGNSEEGSSMRLVEIIFLGLQIVTVALACVGFVVGVLRAHMRWLTITSLIFTLSFLLMAAMAEPLARSLTPVAGFVVLYAVMGTRSMAGLARRQQLA